MAFEQNIQDQAAYFESVGDASFKQSWKSVSAPAIASETLDGSFDCNICLDSVHDPVVTLCGHLYCWPCIYKWLHVQSSSPEPEKEPNCPVCKTNISKSSLVPLYGRANSPSEAEPKRHQLDLVIPPRPPAIGVNTLLTVDQQLHPNPFEPHSHSFPNQQYFSHPLGSFASMAPSNFGGTPMASFGGPSVQMFGEMVFARMFGTSDTSLFAYPNQNSFPLAGSVSPRMRRQEMQLDKSLNRVTIFLLCCFFLCLIFF
ncbi:hypothetical protein RJ639_031835 [Escallonia herrerae]|uniref:E3 ubiquitin-protein ligase RMA n=1 Tax=Escallonia herrerae TaxID=1293975 RepID=A0AA88X2F9_9ASTE|nr:hypothetical protein RJ639_031835 [Escallonia herrerae]